MADNNIFTLTITEETPTEAGPILTPTDNGLKIEGGVSGEEIAEIGYIYSNSSCVVDYDISIEGLADGLRIVWEDDSGIVAPFSYSPTEGRKKIYADFGGVGDVCDCTVNITFSTQQAYIQQIQDNETHDLVYPITKTDAVYDSNNVQLSQILDDEKYIFLYNGDKTSLRSFTSPAKYYIPKSIQMSDAPVNNVSYVLKVDVINTNGLVLQNVIQTIYVVDFSRGSLALENVSMVYRRYNYGPALSQLAPVFWTPWELQPTRSEIDELKDQNHIYQDVLINDATNGSNYGVTWAVNSDGTIVFNGTVTPSGFAAETPHEQGGYEDEDGNALILNIWIDQNEKNSRYKNGTYYLSGCPSGGSDSTYYLAAYAKPVNDGGLILTEGPKLMAIDTGSGSSVDNTRYGGLCCVRIVIKEGTICNNLTFNPRLIRQDTINDFLGTTDISSISDGTVTGVLSELNSNHLGNGKVYFMFDRRTVTLPDGTTTAQDVTIDYSDVLPSGTYLMSANIVLGNLNLPYFADRVPKTFIFRITGQSAVIRNQATAWSNYNAYSFLVYAYN